VGGAAVGAEGEVGAGAGWSDFRVKSMRSARETNGFCMDVPLESGGCAWGERRGGVEEPRARARRRRWVTMPAAGVSYAKMARLLGG
jgi:hypothetical protein